MNAITQQAWDPNHYDRAGAFVPQLAADLVELLAPQPGERILDLGAGTGELAHALSERGARVVGLDASQQMVDEACRKYPTLTFLVGDGQTLAFDREFDAVFSNATLHWMPHAHAVAAGVERALKPGGRFVAEFGGARCVQTVREAVRGALDELAIEGQGTPSWYFPTLPEYAAVLDQAGLFVRSLSWFERPTRLPGAGGLDHWLELFCLPLLRALGDDRPRFVAAVTRRCEAQLLQGGDWWLDYTRLRVVASKP